MKIYIAGPMRGYPLFNFPAFDTAAEHYRAAGHEVFNPAEQDREEYGDLTPENAESKGFDLRKALRLDLSWIAEHADGIYLLRGWENSSGARAEKALADALGLNVAYEVPPLVQRDEAGVTGEVRSTSSTGGQKGVKPQRFDLIPALPLTLLAEHYGAGALKYDDHQWRKGYEWSKSFAAMQRHAWQWWNGEDTDVETGSNHLTAVAWHAFALLQYAQDHPDFDDRPRMSAPIVWIPLADIRQATLERTYRNGKSNR